MTSSAVGSINFNSTKAPSGLVCLDLSQNKTTSGAAGSTELISSSYTFDGVTSKKLRGGNFTDNGVETIWLMETQCSVFGGTESTSLIDSFTDYYATGSNTLSRSAGDMINNYPFIIEAS